MLKLLIISSFCFILFLAAHFFIFHKFLIQRKFRAMFFLLLAVSVIGGLIFFITPDTDICGKITEYLFAFNGLFLYFFAGYFYFHLIIVIDRSVSMRALVEIFRAKDRGLTLDEIKERYSLKDKFEDELKDLVFLKRVEPANGKFRNTSKGKFHARGVSFLRDFLNLAKNR